MKHLDLELEKLEGRIAPGLTIPPIGISIGGCSGSSGSDSASGCESESGSADTDCS